MTTPRWLRRLKRKAYFWLRRNAPGGDRLPLRWLYQPITLSGLDRIVKNTYQPGMFQQLLDQEMNALHLDLHRQMGRQIFGDEWFLGPLQGPPAPSRHERFVRQVSDRRVGRPGILGASSMALLREADERLDDC
jgi:hypothetical protein